MTLADVRARFRRSFVRIWSKVKKWFPVKRMGNTGWGAPARDEGHAYFRIQYERMVEAAPTLPRIPDNETNGFFLAFAQVVHELHDRGDDPINPPGVSRVVRPEERLATFGAVGQAAGAASGGWVVWALAAALMSSGWVAAGVQGALKERVEAQRDTIRSNYALVTSQLESARETMADLSEMVRKADSQSRETAAGIEAERERRVRAEMELRRVRNAYEQARAGGDVDYGFGGVRDAGPRAN